MTKGIKPTPVIDRVLRRVVVDDVDGCCLWQGYLMKGYGQISRQDGSHVLTHRVTFEHFIGPVPEGLELDHLCRVTACCNPGHLEPVTHAENIARGEWNGPAAKRARTHCASGHEYTPENTYQRPDGRRRCRACHAAWQRAKRAAA